MDLLTKFLTRKSLFVMHFICASMTMQQSINIPLYIPFAKTTHFGTAFLVACIQHMQEDIDIMLVNNMQHVKLAGMLLWPTLFIQTWQSQHNLLANKRTFHKQKLNQSNHCRYTKKIQKACPNCKLKGNTKPATHSIGRLSKEN